MAYGASVTVRMFSPCCQWVEFGVCGRSQRKEGGNVELDVQDDDVHDKGLRSPPSSASSGFLSDSGLS